MKIYIAVLNQGWIRTELVQVLVHLTHNNKFEISIGYPSDKPIANNRNKIVQEFLKTDYDYLLMIDSDIVPPENILNLADYGKDVIGGLCFAYPSDGIIPLIMDLAPDGGYQVKEMDGTGLVECDAIGSGCIMIHRRVLEKIKKPFENIYDEGGIKIRGLDFSFCRKAKEQGFKVFCHLDYPCGHIVSMDLKQTYAYLQRS